MTMKRTPEHERLHALFHQAWGQAKSSPDYDKGVWRELDNLLVEHTRPREVRTRTALEYQLGLQIKDDELWRGWRGFPIGHWLTLMSALRDHKELPDDSMAALEAWRESKSEGA